MDLKLTIGPRELYKKLMKETSTSESTMKGISKFLITYSLATRQIEELVNILNKNYRLSISLERDNEGFILKVPPDKKMVLPFKYELGGIVDYRHNVYTDHRIFSEWFMDGKIYLRIFSQISKEIEKFIRSKKIRNYQPLIEIFKFLNQTNPLTQISDLKRVQKKIRQYKTIESIPDYLRFIRPYSLGRFCMLETPESDKIGLVRYLTIGASLDEGCNVKAPFYSVKENKICYLGVQDEKDKWIASYDQWGKISNIQARSFHVKKDNKLFKSWYEVGEKSQSEIDYWEVSPIQNLGFSCAMVPFIHHNDGVRAMMGGKNLKQALPLKNQESPLVKTGLEKDLPKLCDLIYFSTKEETIKSVTKKYIRTTDKTYKILKKTPSNQDLPLYQGPRVKKGETVKEGTPLVDVPGVKDGELSLGRNVLVAYMPFKGYNFEDAIVASESLAKKFETEHLIEYRLEAKENEEFTTFTDELGEAHRLSSEGIIIEGIEVRRREVLIRKLIKTEGSYKIEEVNYDKEYPGKVVMSKIESMETIKVATGADNRQKTS